MQKVFNNEMVIHVWAQQSQPFGRNSSGSISFNGAVLDSYATSIALHYGGMVIAADPSQFSVTTNRHTPSSYDVRPARLIYLPLFFEWGKRYHSKRDFPKGGEIKKALLADILELCKEFSKKRVESTRARVANQIDGRLDDLRFICEKFGLIYPAGYSSVEEILELSEDKIQAIRKAEENARKRELAKKRKKQKEEKARLEQWLNGETADFPYSFYYGKPLLTIRGDVVYTSRGAEAPLSHVKKALVLYRRITAAGHTWERNGERCQLGIFQLDRIDESGNAAAGCHLFEADEIKRFMDKWGL